MQEYNIPSFPFAKIPLDISGLYPQTLSGNEDIVTFIDMYSSWLETFVIPNKKSQTTAHLIVDEIFPRIGTLLQLVTDEREARRFKNTPRNYIVLPSTKQR